MYSMEAVNDNPYGLTFFIQLVSELPGLNALGVAFCEVNSTQPLVTTHPVGLAARHRAVTQLAQEFPQTASQYTTILYTICTIYSICSNQPPP